LSYKDAEKMINTFDESQIASLESDIAKRIKTMHEKMVSSLNHSFKLENFSNISVADLGWLVDLLTYRKGFIAYEFGCENIENLSRRER
jgi:ADP-dependent phosphofructokinase/glucokinase